MQSSILHRELICLTGCGTAAASPGGNPPIGEAAPQTSDTPAQIAVANAESDGGAVKVSYEEVFKPYEQFGLIYDSGKKELQYQGKTVRWFFRSQWKVGRCEGIFGG